MAIGVNYAGRGCQTGRQFSSTLGRGAYFVIRKFRRQLDTDHQDSSWC